MICYFSIFEGTCVQVAKPKLSHQNSHTKFSSWLIGHYFLKTYFIFVARIFDLSICLGNLSFP